MVNSLKPFARIGLAMSRPPVAVILGLFAAIGAATSGEVLHMTPRLGGVLALVVLLLINASSLNDLADEAIDKINLKGSPARPLASGLASRRDLWRLSAMASIFALGLGFLISPMTGLAVFAGLAFNWFYSMKPFQISHHPLLTPLLVPIAYVAAPFVIGSIAYGHSVHFGLLAGIYVCFIGRILLKDFRDVKGDARYGKQTFLLRYGRSKTTAASALLWTAGAIILTAQNPLYGLSVLVYLPFIFFALSRLYNADSKQQELILIWALARVATAAALAVFVLIQLSGHNQAYQLAMAFIAGLPMVGYYFTALKMSGVKVPLITSRSGAVVFGNHPELPANLFW